MGRKLNVEYATLQGFFWMLYSLIGSYVSVFLLGKGYTNTDIGEIMAISSVTAIALQPLLAQISDNIRKITLTKLIQIQILVMFVICVSLLFFNTKSAGLTILYIAVFSWHTIVQPLINSLCFYLQRTGHHINFGLCRSIGSLLYAAITSVMGIFVEAKGINIIPVTGAVICLAIIIILGFIDKTYGKAMSVLSGRGEDDINHQKVEIISFKEFLSNNKTYFVFSLGVIGLFFGNSGINTFMIQITESVNGSESDMGMLLGYMGALEIPGLMFYDKLRRRFKITTLLTVSTAGFLVKIFLLYTATSVPQLYFAMTWQLISFGIYLAAMVDFINSIMNRGEAVRGQAVYTIMVTVGTVLSSIVGGRILDSYSVKVFLGLATILTAIGMVVLIFFSRKLESLQKV